MKFYKGVRFKLAVLYSTITLTTLIVFGVYQYISLWHVMIDNLDARLRDELLDFRREQTPLTAKGMAEYADFVSAQSVMAPLQPTVFAQFADKRGRVLAHSKQAPASDTLASSTGFHLAAKGMEAAETVYGKFEVPIRVLSVAVETSQGDDVVLQLGVSMRRTIITSEGFLRNLAIAIAVLFFVSLLAGWAMATKSLRPVHDIIETTRAITAERLQERLHPVGSEDEIDQLIHTLNNMIERLEAAFKQISQFTADASHELRTPLAVMRGEIEVALEYSKTVAELRSVLASMLEEIDRLSGIASDLLLLARADARLGAEHFENVNIQQLLMDVVSDAKVLAASRGIELRSGPIQEGVLLGNRDWLRRIFMNLLDNAVKFTPSGGEVKLSCEIRDGKAMVVVEDNGIGIDPKDLPQVFNRFYKRSPVGTPASDKGVGLGLSICKALAEQHGGTISVQSVLHRGTTFTILLPLLSASTSSASSI